MAIGEDGEGVWVRGARGRVHGLRLRGLDGEEEGGNVAYACLRFIVLSLLLA